MSSLFSHIHPPSWAYSIRTKLALVTSFLILLISVFIYWFFPTELERQSVAAVGDKANSIVSMLAYSVGPALLFDDHPVLCDLVLGAKQDPDVEYIVVVDDSGRIIATHDSVRAFETRFADVDLKEQTSEDGSTFQTVAPVVAQRRFLGRVYLGLSLRGVNEEIARSRRTIAWVSLCISLIGILFVTVLSTLITKPLVVMVGAVKKLATGDWSQRARVTTKDEVGHLAGAFNSMVENLELANDDLRRSEKNYRNLFESNPHPMWVHDVDSRHILEVNDAAIECYGYSREQFLKMTIHDIILDGPFESMDQLISRTGNLSRSTGWRHLRNDGAVIDVEMSSHSLPYRNGRKARFVLANDITKRVRAEVLLRESEERYRDLFESASDLILSIGADWKFQFVNKAWMDTLKFKRDEVSELHIFSIIKETELPRFKIALRDSLSGKQLDRVQTVFIGKDGSEIVVEGSISTRFENDTPVSTRGIFRDITERRRTEELLRESEEHYRVLSEATFEGISVTENGIIVDANTQYGRMLGYEREQLIGKSVYELISPDDREFVQEQIRIGKSEPYQHRLVRGDGSLIFVEVYAQSCNYRGRTVRISAVRDITERKRAETAILIQKTRFEQLFENAPIGIVLADKTGKIVQYNKVFQSMFGYTPEDLSGKEIDQLIVPEHLTNEGRALSEKTLCGESIQTETVRRCNDGTLIDVGLYGVPILVNGNSLGLFGMYVDISERKRSEKEIRMLAACVRGISESISITDADDRIIFVNEAFERTYGYHRDEVIGEPITIMRASTDESVPVLRSTLDGGWHGELMNRRKDGSEFPIQLSTSIIRDSQKNVIALVGVANDITEAKRAGQRQQELMKELESINKELNDFAYIVSHDLKAPLRAIGSLVSWLTTDYGNKLGDEGNELLQTLLGRTKRMHDLIDGVLKYSRIGRTKEESGPVELERLVPDVVDMIAPPPNIEVRIQRPLPTILGENTRVQQVFQNLLSNAIKFMDKPDGMIEIGCERENGHWKFKVADNGPGIEERHFGKIFQIFQTLSARDEYESTGIGLTIVKKVVEQYGGKVWVESKVGSGTTFYFTFPAHQHN